jgi:hypothetical protein
MEQEDLTSDEAINRYVAARNKRDLFSGQLPKWDGEISRVDAELKQAVAEIRTPGCANLDNDLLLQEAAEFRDHIRPFVPDEGLRERVVTMVLPFLPYASAVPTWRAFATHGPGRDSSGVTDADFCIKAVEELKAYLKNKRR